MKKYVSYYRVSTQKQANSNLGLEGQKTMVSNFLNTNQGELIASFTEVESGTSNKQRVIIYEAIEYAKQNNAILVIAKIDRLARNVHFISGLMNANVEFVCCDMPAANNLTIFLMSALAEEEARLISSRTKAALAEKKKIMKLGTPENLTYEDRMKGVRVRQEKAKNQKTNIQASAMIVQYREKAYSYGKIAELLTQNNFMTVTGKKFTSTTVMRLYKRSQKDCN
jgi:DNA invertase Pin-like site-specific DNA recombinase